MKKQKMAITLIVLSMCVVFQSCSQDEDVYSCNHEVNDWVKDNKLYIRTLSRSQWYELDYNVSRAASYISASAESNCNCNKASMFSCFGGLDCASSKCEETINGCGLLWAAACDGTCGGI